MKKQLWDKPTGRKNSAGKNEIVTTKYLIIFKLDA